MKKIMVLFTFLVFLTPLFSDAPYEIDFYGVTSADLDKNMADMTSDLYYTQLCEIKNFEVTDKRNFFTSIPDKDLLSENKLSFYTIISKKENSTKWIASLHIINPNQNTEYSASKEYDSYYKILMESKLELRESFISLIEDNSSKKSLNENPDIPAIDMPFENSSAPKASSENLAGTWQGEENENFIEKILIMRGGRGFVIFKNGASMNISVKVSNSDSLVTITQTGKANASFFPDLPRQKALEAALSAQPITWKLKLTNDNTLTGTKTTLLADGDNIESGDLAVSWSRKL